MLEGLDLSQIQDEGARDHVSVSTPPGRHSNIPTTSWTLHIVATVQCYVKRPPRIARTGLPGCGGRPSVSRWWKFAATSLDVEVSSTE